MGTKSSKKRKDGCFPATNDRNKTKSNSTGRSRTVRNQEETNLICKESEGQGINIWSANLPNAANSESGKFKQLPSQKLREVESITNSGGFALAANNPEEGSEDSDQETKTETQGRDGLSLSRNRTMEQKSASQMTEPPGTARPTQVSSLVSLSLTKTTTEEQDVDASGELTANLETGERELEIMQELVSKKIINNQNLMRDLALRLDQYDTAVKNWSDLAYALEVPMDIIAKCKINAAYSAAQKFLQFLETRRPNLKIKDFVLKLENIDRNDIKDIITKALSNPENDTQRISDVFNNNVQLGDEIVMQLDIKSPVKKGWRHLAYEFGFEKKEVEVIGSGCKNPTAGVLDYEFKRNPNFTVGSFKNHIAEMKRNDVLDLLLDYNDGTEKLEKIMPRDSYLLEAVSSCLNNENTGSQHWRHFASRLEIPPDIYDSYDPKHPHSPTEMLLDWLVGKYPDFTVGQLCEKIQSIDRNDVFELIENALQST